VTSPGSHVSGHFNWTPVKLLTSNSGKGIKLVNLQDREAQAERAPICSRRGLSSGMSVLLG
jgi:hypothetical protein